MLVDTSAWIELLRATGSAADLALTRALDEGDKVTVTGVVVQEVLQGCRNEEQASEVAKLLATCRSAEPVYPATYDHAAMLYRRCRSAGRTVRGTMDCLIAAVALEHGLDVLAHDRDFGALAAICGVRLSLPPPSRGK